MSSGGIERDADAAQRGDEIGQAFEREVFAVQRDEHRVGGDERVEREQAERRRGIDQDEVEARAQRLEERAETAIAIGERDQLDLGAGEIAGRRDHERGCATLVARMKSSADGFVGRERLIDGAARRRLVPSGRGRSWRCLGGRRRRAASGDRRVRRRLPTLMAVVVLPTPPFWLVTAITFPCNDLWSLFGFDLESASSGGIITGINPKLLVASRQCTVADSLRCLRAIRKLRWWRQQQR